MHNRRGFTLIELLIVVVVLGILATIAIPRYWEMRQRAYVASMKADLRTLANSQELHHSVAMQYSTDQGALDFESSEDVVVVVTSATGTGWAATATHPGVPDFQCGVFYGDATAADAPPATIAGVIACEDL